MQSREKLEQPAVRGNQRGDLFQNLLNLDMRLSEAVQRSPEVSPGWKAVAFLAHSGDLWFWVTGLAGLWLLAPLSRAWAAFLILAIVALAALVMGIKILVRRRRPEGDWEFIHRITDPHSFPSGHAARAWMLAVFAIHAGSPILASAAVLWAILVSLSRVATRMHYFSDVLAGTLLGIPAGLLFLAVRPVLSAWLPGIF